MSGLDRLAGLNDAVVAYPDGVGHSWDAGGCCGVAVQEHLDDVQFILAVVADVERRVPIDPARVAVTGFSNGGLMSYRLACQRPDVFRAAVAVAGDVVVPRCTPARAVSLLHVHGLLDRVIPIAGTSDSSLDAEGFPPAIASVQRIATADRCRGSGTMRSTRTLTWWTATSCASGAAVQFVTVDAMTHHYPTGGKASRAYGVDMARLTWAFLRGAWPE
jgi:polyhydroxybutyrate depolymerase